MRVISVVCALLTTLLTTAPLAQRAWKPGTWVTPTTAGAYAIETRTDLIVANATSSAGTVAATPGTAVQFAIDGQTLYVLDAEKHEHPLALVSAGAKYSRNYPAIGGGHYIKAVAAGGAQVTLEDGSRWDIDSRQHFAVVGWQPDDLIAIRREEGDADFSFEIDNTTQDDGSLANYRIR